MNKSLCRLVVLCGVALGAVAPSPTFAQTVRDGKLLITVVDPSGGVIPGATITVVGSDDATKVATLKPLTTSAQGLATFETLALGRYTIEAEFAAFDKGVLKDVRVRSGDNKHVIVLQLKKVADEASVTQDRQAAAASRSGSAFGTTLTREEILALSDDPAEMAQQLIDMAGGNAVIRVDSFTGGPLPSKAQIKSIHITRDAFAAENHSAEIEGIDIITQPGIGPLHGGFGSRFRDGSMSGRSPFTPVKGPEFSQNYDANIGGTVVKEKSSFSVSARRQQAYDTPIAYAKLPDGSVLSEILPLRRPNDTWSVYGLFDYALTKDQTLRMSYSQSSQIRKNLGVGAYDLSDRAYATTSGDREFRAQIAGPLGRRAFANTRFQAQWQNSSSSSSVEAPTIRVQDEFTNGGAQVRGGRHVRDFEIASDIDYIRGIHSWRGGVLFEGGTYRSDDSTNYLGTYTFASMAAYQAGKPTSYTRRVGDPLVEYSNWEVGAYIQDDIRVSKALTLSPGIRYEVQTHVRDYAKIGPRFGLTWAPFVSGRTTLRGSWGIFSNWVTANNYEQTLRVDGFRQQDLSIANPRYPNPGNVGLLSATNKYLLDSDVSMIRTVRVSLGIDQTLTPRVRVSAIYSAVDGTHALRGLNLNAPVNGVRPDRTFANVIEAVSDAGTRSHQLQTNLTLNFAPTGRAPAGERFNARRLNLRIGYTLSKGENNTDGAFQVPASGTPSTEWSASSGDRRHRVSVSLNSQQVKNLNATLSLAANTGTPYSMLTGLDNNGDLIFNDRPTGVARNTIRTPAQITLNANFAYAINMTGAASAGGRDGGKDDARNGAGRRLAVTLSITNLTNRSNYSGFSGVVTSSNFMTATAVSNPRRIDFGLTFGF